MRRTKKIWVVTLVALFLAFGLFASHSFADTHKSYSVPNLTTRTLFYVPTGQVYLLKSAIISKTDGTGTCCQRIFKGGVAQTAFISLQGYGTEQVHFDPPIIFYSGQSVRVRNGASSGPTSFTLVGEFLR